MNQNPNVKTSKSQSDLILEHLQSGRSLTPSEALHYFDCMRLGARVYDLKKQGHNIRSRLYRTASGKHVKRYFIEK